MVKVGTLVELIFEMVVQYGYLCGSLPLNYLFAYFDNEHQLVNLHHGGRKESTKESLYLDLSTDFDEVLQWRLEI